MKNLFLLLALLLLSNEMFGVSVKVCVYDECTGEPIPGWTVNLFDSGPKGPLHYDRDFITDRDGCVEFTWAQQGQVSISVENGQSWNVFNTLNVSTSVIPITCMQVVENDDAGYPTSTTTLKETDGCNDWIFTSNVVSECNNPTMDFCVPEGSDAGNYCFENRVINCENDQIVAFGCGDLDFSSIFDGLPAGKYTIQTYYGCCGEDDEGEPTKCPEDPEGPMERTIRWEPAVDFGDVNFDWMVSAPIEQANNEATSDQGDNLLFTNDHPFPSLGELTAGVDLDLSGISSNATHISVSLRQLNDCTENGTSLYSQTWSTNGNLPSTLNFNQLTQGYFIMGQGYVKGATCFEICIEVGDGSCSVQKCGTFTIEDNCPFCFRAPTTANVTFTIAPNPVSDYLYIRASDESLSFSITDISGRQVYNGPFTQNLNVGGWNTGFYFARYFDQQGNSHVEKFFKQ